MVKTFDVPTQVMFEILVDGEINYGIAFGEWVICAYDGDFYTLDEVEILKEFINWGNLTECIRE